MTANQLLDAHTAALGNDPAYRAIWATVQAEPERLRLLRAMTIWQERDRLVTLRQDVTIAEPTTPAKTCGNCALVQWPEHGHGRCAGKAVRLTDAPHDDDCWQPAKSDAARKGVQS